MNGLVRDWRFVPDPAPAWVQRRARLAWWLFAQPFPAHAVLRGASPRSQWVVYFSYCPDGVLATHQRFALQRMRDEGLAVLVVCATPGADRLPPELSASTGLADALIWKALPGYDFSAYRVALAHLAQVCSGSRVLLLNDSVWGPLSPLSPWLERTPWELTGFTSSATWGPHIQSYAWIVRASTPDFLEAVRKVMPARRCLNRFDDVVLAQELGLAAAAARQMTVGSFFHGDGVFVGNPMLERPAELLQAGLPFLKRALLGKHAGRLSREAVLSLLSEAGHPPVLGF
ncbi:MAG: hypothetical protein RL227_1889 [Pseudomonadota bacterium]|jgi:lipopolysaccharide biosynthesis protein